MLITTATSYQTTASEVTSFRHKDKDCVASAVFPPQPLHQLHRTTLITSFSTTKSSTMKFSTALLVASLAATTDAFSIQYGASVRGSTELYARQPIMAGNWKVSPIELITKQDNIRVFIDL